MDLKEQKYVCTLAECKSLTRASERLYISQPAPVHYTQLTLPTSEPV
mgnify:CR=1 FL=1